MIALIGEVPAHLRAVLTSVDIKRVCIDFWFVFDGEISDEDKEFVSSFMAEVSAHFSFDIAGNTFIERLDAPQEITFPGCYIYLRDEACNMIDLRKTTKGKFLDALSSDYFSLSLRIQDALLGKIEPYLRAVKADLNELKSEIYVWIYFDGVISQTTKNIILGIEKEIAFHFPNFLVKVFSVPLPYPLFIPSLGDWIYKRKELTTEEERKADEVNSSSLNKELGLLAIQNALLAKVPSNLRAVQVSINEECLKAWFFWEQEPTDKEAHIVREFEYALQMSYLEKRFYLESHEILPSYATPVYLRYEKSQENPPKYNKQSFSFRYDLPWQALQYMQLSAQSALLGRVGSALYAVKVSIDQYKKTYYVWFYYHSEISELDRILAHDVARQLKPSDEYSAEVHLDILLPSEKVPHIGQLVLLKI